MGSGGACSWRLAPSLAGASVQMSINARALPEDALSPLAPPLHSLVALLASITYLGLNHLGTAGGAREYFARGVGVIGVKASAAGCGVRWRRCWRTPDCTRKSTPEPRGAPRLEKDEFSCTSSPAPQPLTQTSFLLSCEQRCRDDPIGHILGEGESAGEIPFTGVWVIGAGGC